jgi:hypothetical protein
MKRTAKLGLVVVVASFVAGVAIAATSPSVVTNSATRVTDTTAVLNGTVNPNGAETSYTFAWGLTTAYGYGSTPHSAGKGTKPVAVHVTIGGLIPGTIYHFHLIALNGSGTSFGTDRTFRTTGHPPAGVFTGPATALGPNFATVTGTVVPNGQATQWFFQYGTTPLLGLSTGGGTVPGTAPAVVAWTIAGLSPGTLFYYRLVGLHGSSVVSNGAEQTFITYPSPRPVPQVRAATTPGRDRHKPFVFTTSATVVGPSSLPQSVACDQGANATITYLFHRQKVGFTAVPLQPNCTFSAQMVFTHRFGTRKQRGRREALRVLIHFRGNGYLAPSDARAESVTIG